MIGLETALCYILTVKSKLMVNFYTATNL